jgi:hypothetical protein
MRHLLGAAAATTILAALAMSGPAAAEPRQDAGIHQKVANEEISSQRRSYRRHYVRRYWGPRYGYYGYGPRYYGGYGYPYYGSYGYYAPRPYFRVGPFGFW